MVLGVFEKSFDNDWKNFLFVLLDHFNNVIIVE